MRLAALAVPLAVSMLLAGCGAGGGSEATGPSDDTRITVLPADPGTSVGISGGPPQGSVSVGGRELGGTSIEVRVSDLLGELRELQAGDGTTTVVEAGEGGSTVIVFPDEVLFDFDAAELKPDARAALDRIVELLGLTADPSVPVIGHTDSRGSDEYNLDLSRRRAEAVAGFLTGAGIEPGRVQPEGRGESEPVAANENSDGSDNPAGRGQNRRVEVIIADLPGQG